MLENSEYIKIVVGLIAVLNPFGAVPLFIGMTKSQQPAERLNTIHVAAMAVCIILLVSLFFGEVLLSIFGITIDSFRVGGGILVLLMAISMLHANTSRARQTEEEANESIDKESVAIVPLAMPLLAGPGAISSVILAAHRSSGISHYMMIATGIIVVSGIVWSILRLSPWIAQRVGATGINVFTRIMGLILAAIAIEFIANGLKGLFPALA